jgi:ABC-type transporter Mla subunit MlaD
MNINEVIGNDDFRQNIAESLKHVSELTAEINEMAINFHKNLGQIDTTVQNISTITGAAETIVKKIDTFVGDLADDGTLPANLKTIVADAAKLTTTFNANRENFAATIQNLDHITSHLAKVTREIDPTKGVFRLLTDDRVGADLIPTLHSLRRAANTLATVGISDLIADYFVGSKIAEKWLTTHRGSPAEMATQWQTWMTQNKTFTAALGAATTAPHGAATPNVFSPTHHAAPRAIAAPEIYYDPVETAPAPPPRSAAPPARGGAASHPLQSLYER